MSEIIDVFKIKTVLQFKSLGTDTAYSMGGAITDQFLYRTEDPVVNFVFTI